MPLKTSAPPEDYNDDKQHHAGEGWSASNQIPTVGGLLAKQKRATEGDQPEPNAEKEETMAKAKAHKANPAKTFQRKGERTVHDPVTGQDVVIKDARIEDYANKKLFSKDALDPSKTDVPGPSTNIPDGMNTKKQTIKFTTPHPAEPSNINLQQFPPPYDKDTLKPIISPLASYSYAIMGGLAVIWIATAFRVGLLGFFMRSALIGGVAVGVYVTHGMVSRKLEKELERVRFDMHKQRGQMFSPPTPESVEWLNSFTKVIWPLINPDMFISLTDMIEDVMQASLPGFVDAVKIEDFGIGRNALRIISMRGLPDQPHEKEYPRDDWINLSDKSVRTSKSQDTNEDEKKNEGESEQDLDQTGDYVNFEVSFAYTAPPGTKKLHNENISMIIQFFFGFHDWLHIPIPIWIAVESLVGTARLRCQIVSQPPFIRNLTFTLMGVPHIEASAIPLTSKLPNVLDLPLVSSFVQSSIAAAANDYVAPRSMTLNMAQILSGSGIKKDTKALGILAITIHHAVDLSAQDRNGFSDPYVVLAYAKFGKPLYSTRIIQHDLNPVWEETAYLLVSDDEVRAKESLSVQLWDSDKMNADDLVGRVQVSLVDLMLNANEVQHRTDRLMGFEDADTMSGSLFWSVAYYDKAKLNSQLKKEAGVDHSLPKQLQDRNELKVESNTVDTEEEADVLRTPPDPRFPSGVLSIIVHQINNLERANLKGTSGDREGKAGQDTDEPSEQSHNLPSAYCELIVNDDLIYKTRVKPYTTMPFFEAGTERFIHDWKDTIVRVVIRDSRLREHDPILGIVNLPLSEILTDSSQVTRLFALQDGVGFGRVNVSILFRSIQINLPRELRGWDTGTVCITSAIKVEPDAGVQFSFKEKKLLLHTSDAQQKLPGQAASVGADGGIQWDVSEDIRVPVYNRYASALFFDYGGSVSVGPLGKKVEAYAALWLRDLVDDEETKIRIPVIVTHNFQALRQNFINDQTKKTHKYEVVGWLTCTVLIDSGLDADHEKYVISQVSRHEYETYDRIEGQAAIAEKNAHANDDGVIDSRERKAIQQAHKKALESRHRGKMQYKLVRTAKWANDGLKDRVRAVKDNMIWSNKSEEKVASEA